MDTKTTTIPARILIQVREGVPNVITEFELMIDADGTRPATPDEAANGSKLSHSVSTLSMIGGLYAAIAELWQEQKAEYSPEDQAIVYRWLDEMNAWVGEKTDRPAQVDPDPLH